MVRMEWSPWGAAVFGVVFVGLVVLIALGKADISALAMIMTWLIPSPISSKRPVEVFQGDPPEVH